MKTTAGYIKNFLSGLSDETKIEITETQIIVTPTERMAGWQSNSKVDVVEAAKLREQGITYQEIANKFGVSRQAVYSYIKRYLEKTKNIQNQFNEGVDLDSK